MKWNDYLMNAWNKAANSKVVDSIASGINRPINRAFQDYNKALGRPQPRTSYTEQVAINKANPFFNRDNTVQDWAFKKVPHEFKTRGIAEGVHGLTNPIMMNPYIEPIAEPLISTARQEFARSENNQWNDIMRKMLGIGPNRYQMKGNIYIPPTNVSPYSIDNADEYEIYPQ